LNLEIFREFVFSQAWQRVENAISFRQMTELASLVMADNDGFFF
jgi:hypothetical protein